ncbi:MAG: DUF58 domain-containing protein [Firmicutes bacterium]|nr:DUF58 domain-containing protein [Bacillota bacterium]
MTGRRIIYILWIAAVLLPHLFTNNFGTWILLILTFVVPGIGILGSRRAAQSLALQWQQMPRGGDGGRDLPRSTAGNSPRGATGALPPVCITLINHSRIPLTCVHIELEDRNLLTAETSRQESRISLPGRFEQEIQFDFPTDCCGARQIRVCSCRAEDPFGLMQWSGALPEEMRSLVRPRAGALPEGVLAGTQADGGEAQGNRAAWSGDLDPALIRAYQPGDPVQQIHWKLSEKVDRTLMLERNEPTRQQLKILLNDRPSQAQAPAASLRGIGSRQLSELFETAAALMQRLEELEIPYVLQKLSGREGLEQILSEPFYGEGATREAPEAGAILLTPGSGGVIAERIGEER